MSADQIAEIRPLIVEPEGLSPAEQGDWVARFQVSGNENLWVEVILGTVNFAYPYEDEPRKHLAQVGVEPLEGLDLEQWKPSVYATFQYTHQSARNTARFIDQIFERVLLSGDDYSLDGMLEKIG